MSSVAYLLRPEYFPFAVALTLMVSLAALEVLGMGMSLLCDSIGVDIGLDSDGDGLPDSAFLALLGFGRVPLGVMLVCWLLLYGCGGVALQKLCTAYAGAPLPAWQAGLWALLPAGVLNSLWVRLLGRVMPKDETYAVTIESLINREAVVLDGVARAALPARAMVRDSHGQAHYVMVVPADSEPLLAGQRVVLKRKLDFKFEAVPLVAPHS